MPKPNDPDILKHAVGLLTPETSEDHIRAIAKVRGILCDFELNQRSTTTWGAINSELEGIKQGAEELRTRWNRASAITHNRICWRPDLYEKFKDIDGYLQSLARTASSQAGEIKEVREDHNLKGRAGSFPEPDHLMIEFVRDCLRVFENFRPGDASSTEGGPFREFVSTVHELRTGEEGVDYKRRVARVMREWRDIRHDSLGSEQSQAEIIEEMIEARRFPKNTRSDD